MCKGFPFTWDFPLQGLDLLRMFGRRQGAMARQRRRSAAGRPRYPLEMAEEEIETYYMMKESKLPKFGPEV